MPVQKALESSGKFIRSAVETAAPQFSTNPTAPTARDYSTSGLAAGVTVIFVAALHHGVQVDLSPEVVAALTTVVGFLLARYFRY